MRTDGDLWSVLERAGLRPPADGGGSEASAALRWARSGGLWLTGHADGVPLCPPVDVLAAIDRMLDALDRAIGEVPGLHERDDRDRAEDLLFGRGGLMGHRRRGRTSAGGSCRLLRAVDGWAAFNLARQVDIDSVPAAVGGGAGGDAWHQLASQLMQQGAAPVVARARELGIPSAVLPSVEHGVEIQALRVRQLTRRSRRVGPELVVVDLSSMWAGPLAARLVGLTGARVIKVESITRPDGVRAGNRSFAAWLHPGHESVALDFRTDAGRSALRRLLGYADLVIEASRPRALRQLGVDREEIIAASGACWVTITGYGSGAGAGWSAFGDDAAVAGGLVATDSGGAPVFCGDAIGDPLSGVVSALAGAVVLAAGGGWHVEVAMAGVVAEIVGTAPPMDTHQVLRAGRRWVVRAGGGEAFMEPPPSLRVPDSAMAPLGNRTARVLAEVGGPHM